jgi:hypothetical protein
VTPPPVAEPKFNADIAWAIYNNFGRTSGDLENFKLELEKDLAGKTEAERAERLKDFPATAPYRLNEGGAETDGAAIEAVKEAVANFEARVQAEAIEDAAWEATEADAAATLAEAEKALQTATAQAAAFAGSAPIPSTDAYEGEPVAPADEAPAAPGSAKELTENKVLHLCQMGGVRPWRGKATAKQYKPKHWQIIGATREIGLFTVQADGTITFTDSRYPKDEPIHMTSWGSRMSAPEDKAA